jgi:hypothetical protein
MRLMESVAVTKRLADLFTPDELWDETEVIGRLAMEYGVSFWKKACAFPLPVKEAAPDHAANHWTNLGRPIKTAFRNATKQQRQLVAAKAAKFQSDRIVVLDGNQIIDGNHHIVAAIKAGQPIKYIDLADLPEL